MTSGRKYHTVDVVFVRNGPDPVPLKMPDGFENAGTHNLLTYRSHQETLDAWTLMELVADYVAYRKRVSPSPEDLLPEDEFRLYAISALYPAELAREIPLTPIQEGV